MLAFITGFMFNGKFQLNNLDMYLTIIHRNVVTNIYSYHLYTVNVIVKDI